MVTVFIPDQTASFLSQDSRIAAGTAAQDLMDAFCQAMKITSIPVWSCTDGSELVTLDGEARQALVVSLDLGEAFADYIDGCGSTGEALTITALVNTFLTAMGADCLRLTVAGAVLESGHAVYDSPIVYDAFANTKDSGLLG